MITDVDFRRFQAWERRTRGYHVSPFTAEIEPRYTPLVASGNPQVGKLDDGRRPGFWHTLFSPPREVAQQREAFEENGADPLIEQTLFIEHQLILPEQYVGRRDFASQFLNSLHNLLHPLSFELLGISEGIVVQICCSPSDERPVLDSLKAYFPEVKLRRSHDLLRKEWFSESRFGTLIDFGLYNEFFRPLRAGTNLESDPLIGVIGTLETLDKDELGLLQLLFRPAVAPWGNDLWAFVSTGHESPEFLRTVREKIDEPLHACVIRVAALASSHAASFERARQIGNAILVATGSDQNSLIPLDNEQYPDEIHAADILNRETHRTGVLLNTPELLSIVHLPSASVRATRLVRQSVRTKAAPFITAQGSTLLGSNEHDGEVRQVFLGLQQRLRHTYVIGASGTGKSTLLLNLILQDIEQGSGIALLDPHGDLVEDVLSRIPERRVRDVVLIDPTDSEYSVGLNILAAHSEVERTLLSSDLVGVFRRLSTSWGDQMTAVFGNAILAFLESKVGGSLVDLRRFLVDVDFRDRFLFTVRDAEVIYFWRREFPLLKGLPQAPLLTRLDAFLRPKPVRQMVAQKKNHLDFRRLMDGRKILLAKLSQGTIGEENAYLLGSLLTTKISQAASSRQEQERESRVPFFLYIDEFHNFITPSIASLLSGVRKYAVGLVLAHQDLRQIRSRSEEVASSVLSSPYTRVIFRVGDQDGRALAEGLSTFEGKDLQNLAIGRAIARVERAEFDFNLAVDLAPEVDDAESRSRRDSIVQSSRRQYATRIENLGPQEEVASPLPLLTPEQAAQAPQAMSPTRKLDAPVVKKPLSKTSSDDGSLPGRGGPQHKYLQSLLKRAGEDRGFRVTLEKRVLDGAGLVDVVMEREEVSIACEISVTTPLDHEMKNLSKCLAAGFDHVVFLTSDKRTLGEARAQMAAESERADERLRFLTPQTFLEFLEELDAKSAQSTQNLRGYRVVVKHRALSEEEKKERERQISDVISKSLRRMR